MYVRVCARVYASMCIGHVCVWALERIGERAFNVLAACACDLNNYISHACSRVRQQYTNVSCCDQYLPKYTAAFIRVTTVRWRVTYN